MNDAALRKPIPWTGARWWALVGIVLALQIVLIFALSSRLPPPVPPAPAPGGLSLLTEGDARPSSERAWADDPAQLALVSARGFSGPVWRRLPGFQPSLLLWAEPPRWLTQNARRLGQIEDLAPPQVLQPALAVAARPTPHAMSNATLQQPLQTKSIARVEGDLAKRGWLNQPLPPSWSNSDVLPPTTVQLVVDRNGLVLSVTILTRSGLAAADQWAIDQGRSARFEPLARGVDAPPLAWGRLVFQWHVVPPSTNAP